MAQKVVATHQIADHGTPWANLRLARGLGASPCNLRLARGADAPSGRCPPRSRAGRPLGRVSASLKTALDPRHHKCSPVRSIKCSGMSRAPESKANPRHAGPLTLLGKSSPALFGQPALWPSLTLCGHCVGRPMSFLDTVPPTPVPPSRRPLERGQRHPQKEDDAMT
jgi:hypothetical protein